MYVVRRFAIQVLTWHAHPCYDQEFMYIVNDRLIRVTTYDTS